MGANSHFRGQNKLSSSPSPVVLGPALAAAFLLEAWASTVAAYLMLLEFLVLLVDLTEAPPDAPSFLVGDGFQLLLFSWVHTTST